MGRANQARICCRQLLQLTFTGRLEPEPLAILAACGSAAIEFRCRAPCRDGKLHPIRWEIGDANRGTLRAPCLKIPGATSRLSVRCASRAAAARRWSRTAD